MTEVVRSSSGLPALRDGGERPDDRRRAGVLRGGGAAGDAGSEREPSGKQRLDGSRLGAPLPAR